MVKHYQKSFFTTISTKALSAAGDCLTYKQREIVVLEIHSTPCYSTTDGHPVYLAEIMYKDDFADEIRRRQSNIDNLLCGFDV